MMDSLRLRRAVVSVVLAAAGAAATSQPQQSGPFHIVQYRQPLRTQPELHFSNDETWCAPRSRRA